MDMLFDEVFNNFSVNNRKKSEINRWLEFVNNSGNLNKFLSRLRSNKKLQSKTLSELFSGYFINDILGYKLLDWNCGTINGKNVDFIIRDGEQKVYCEVKAPGWDMELTQDERLNGRKDRAKYLSGDVRHVAPWKAIRHHVKKSYDKFLPSEINILIVHDDLFLSLLEIPSQIDIALFDDSKIYGNESGYFLSSRFKFLSGILFLHLDYRRKIEYQARYVSNNNADCKFLINFDRTNLIKNNIHKVVLV